MPLLLTALLWLATRFTAAQPTPPFAFDKTMRAWKQPSTDDCRGRPE